ncbi:hypothetical protein REPUB_Repub02eG0183200 [Reevesia pubescens]
MGEGNRSQSEEKYEDERRKTMAVVVEQSSGVARDLKESEARESQKQLKKVTVTNLGGNCEVEVAKVDTCNVHETVTDNAEVVCNVDLNNARSDKHHVITPQTHLKIREHLGLGLSTPSSVGANESNPGDLQLQAFSLDSNTNTKTKTSKTPVFPKNKATSLSQIVSDPLSVSFALDNPCIYQQSFQASDFAGDPQGEITSNSLINSGVIISQTHISSSSLILSPVNTTFTTPTSHSEPIESVPYIVELPQEDEVGVSFLDDQALHQKKSFGEVSLPYMFRKLNLKRVYEEEYQEGKVGANNKKQRLNCGVGIKSQNDVIGGLPHSDGGTGDLSKGKTGSTVL